MSKSGALSAKYVKRGVLIHSAVDPIEEAQTLASQFVAKGATHVTIVGNGLGYLERELIARGIDVTCVELFPDLYAMCERVVLGFNTPKVKGRVHLCFDLQELRTLLNTNHSRSHTYVAPYVISLIDELSSEIAAELLAYKVLSATRELYGPLIESNIVENREAVRRLSHLCTAGRMCTRIAVAVGAGPSLNDCLESIKAARDELLIIAASGAVPILSNHALVPDWTIALEARDSLLRDLEELNSNANVVVFPWTCPKILTANRWNLFLADEQTGVVTSGGTSSLTAADFAFKITRGNVYLVGMDLSEANGVYANGAKREMSSRMIGAPKYATMRNAFEVWLQDHREHRVYQVLPENVSPLRGTRALSPECFAASISEHSRMPQTSEFARD